MFISICAKLSNLLFQRIYSLIIYNLFHFVDLKVCCVFLPDCLGTQEEYFLPI